MNQQSRMLRCSVLQSENETHKDLTKTCSNSSSLAYNLPTHTLTFSPYFNQPLLQAKFSPHSSNTVSIFLFLSTLKTFTQPLQTIGIFFLHVTALRSFLFGEEFPDQPNPKLWPIGIVFFLCMKLYSILQSCLCFSYVQVLFASQAVSSLKIEM